MVKLRVQYIFYRQPVGQNPSAKLIFYPEGLYL